MPEKNKLNFTWDSFFERLESFKNDPKNSPISEALNNLNNYFSNSTEISDEDIQNLARLLLNEPLILHTGHILKKISSTKLSAVDALKLTSSLSRRTNNRHLNVFIFEEISIIALRRLVEDEVITSYFSDIIEFLNKLNQEENRFETLLAEFPITREL